MTWVDALHGGLAAKGYVPADRIYLNVLPTKAKLPALVLLISPMFPHADLRDVWEGTFDLACFDRTQNGALAAAQVVSDDLQQYKPQGGEFFPWVLQGWTLTEARAGLPVPEHTPIQWSGGELWQATVTVTGRLIRNEGG